MNGWRATTRRDHNRRAPRDDGWSVRLLAVVDAALAGVVFVAPLAMGGRHDVGRLVFAALVSVAAVAWFVRQAALGRGTRVPASAAILLVGAAATVYLQIVPLPASWIAWLTPRTTPMLPLWTGGDIPGTLGTWRTGSVNPEATQVALAMLAAYALLLVTVHQRIERVAEATRLVTWVGWSAGLMAAVGFVQFAASNGKFLWIYEHPTRDASRVLCGAFANRNHFAHFLALGVPAIAVALTLQLRTSSLRLPPLGGEGWGGGMRRAFARKSKRVPEAAPPPHQGERNGGVFWLSALLLLLAVAGVFVSCSRGGALALATSGTVIALVLYRGGVLRGARLSALAALGLAVYFGISFSGYDEVVDRLSTLNADSLDEVDARGVRRTIWNANLAAIADGGWLGSGAGSHATVYPLYAADPPGTHYTHAENGYLQVVTENGVPGAVLLVLAMATAALASWRALRGAQSTEALAVAGAGAAGLAASAVHAVCDFVWYVPACMGTTVVLGACVLRLAILNAANSQTTIAKSGEQPPAQAGGWRRRTLARTIATIPRPSRATGLHGVATWGRAGVPWAVGAVIAALLAVGPLVAPACVAGRWDSYLRMAEAHRALALRMESLPPEAAVAQLSQTQAAELATLESMIGELQAVVDGRPDFATARQMLANRLVELFNLRQAMSDNRLGLAHIRDTAIQEQFASAAELRRWLTRATSGNDELLYQAWKHARRAAALAPLEGEPYLRLAELCFLEGAGFAAMDNYLMQAIQVRPYDGSLLFAAGQQWGGRGANDWAAACWQNAFALPGPHRLHIARALVGRAALDELLVEFRPEWDTLPEFWRHYQSSPGDAALLVSYAEQRAAREAPGAAPARAVVTWRTLAEMQHKLGNIDGALASLERACRTAPDDYASRRLYGLVLCDANRFIEGEYQLRWCAGRRTNDGIVAAALLRAGQARLASELPATQVR